MIMVVFGHANTTVTHFDAGNLIFNGGYNIFIQNFIGWGVVRYVLVIFFGTSGYLFFFNLRWNLREFLVKYKTRTRSLLFPYLFWSIWGLLFCFILQSIPIAKAFFANELIVNYSLGQILNVVFINPVPYQLWFLRDLIMLVVLSPLIYWIIRCFKLIPLILLFVIWLGFFDFDFVILTKDAALFFSFGAYLAITKRNALIIRRRQKYYLLFTFLWIAALFFKTFYFEHEILEKVLHKSSVLLGTIAVWSLYDIFNKKGSSQILYYLSSFSFFIYVFHEPILTVIKKGLLFIFGSTELIALFIYFLTPIITISICILFGAFLKRYIPCFYQLITGGR